MPTEEELDPDSDELVDEGEATTKPPIEGHGEFDEGEATTKPP